MYWTFLSVLSDSVLLVSLPFSDTSTPRRSVMHSSGIFRPLQLTHSAPTVTHLYLSHTRPLTLVMNRSCPHFDPTDPKAMRYFLSSLATHLVCRFSWLLWFSFVDESNPSSPPYLLPHLIDNYS
ncbi:hypothetical protein QCA50_009728 [Cerrena zonata]|uniref:Secreted protein n=1 Tax=Cerrena zonata TaxID=2478898 RepID=A0AAW0G1M3_9APHY